MFRTRLRYLTSRRRQHWRDITSLPTMKTKLFFAIALVGAVFLTSGCQTIKERPAVAQLAVQYATIKVVEKNPDRAARVIEIAAYIKANAGNSSAASVALLEVAVRKQIDFERLDAADTFLVDTLIGLVRDELVARLGDGPLSPENALIVAQVAGWIEDAAKMAAGGTASLPSPVHVQGVALQRTSGAALRGGSCAAAANRRTSFAGPDTRSGPILLVEPCWSRAPAYGGSAPGMI